MKINVMGVKRIAGASSKKSGEPYDICSLFAMVPVELVNKPGFEISGAGYELAEIPLDVESLPAFIGLKYPLNLDLLMDSRPRFGKFESICVGFAPIAKAA